MTESGYESGYEAWREALNSFKGQEEVLQSILKHTLSQHEVAQMGIMSDFFFRA